MILNLFFYLFYFFFIIYGLHFCCSIKLQLLFPNQPGQSFLRITPCAMYSKSIQMNLLSYDITDTLMKRVGLKRIIACHLLARRSCFFVSSFFVCKYLLCNCNTVLLFCSLIINSKAGLTTCLARCYALCNLPSPVFHHSLEQRGRCV